MPTFPKQIQSWGIGVPWGERPTNRGVLLVIDTAEVAIVPSEITLDNPGVTTLDVDTSWIVVAPRNVTLDIGVGQDLDVATAAMVVQGQDIFLEVGVVVSLPVGSAQINIEPREITFAVGIGFLVGTSVLEVVPSSIALDVGGID